MSILDAVRNRYVNQMLLHEEAKERLLNDPTYSDRILSHLARPSMTDKIAAKMPKDAPFERALLAIDKEDPRRELLTKLQTDMPSIIRESQFGEDPSESIMKAIQERTTAKKEDIYKFIQSRSGFFDKEVAPLEGYEEWERKNPGWTSPISSFLLGAGGQLASEGLTSRAATALPFIGRAAGALGRMLSFAPPIPGIGMAAKIAGAGLMTIPAIMAADAIKKGAVKAGYELSETPGKRLLEELAFGAPGFIGVNKLAGMGIARSGARLASATRGLQSNLGIMEDKFTSSAATRAVSRDEVLAVAKAERLRGELKLAQEAKLKSYEKLEPEDHEAILRGADPDEIMKARVKANMEKDIAETAARKKATDDEIIAEAKQMTDEDNMLEHGDAIRLAKRRIAPTVEETADDTAALLRAGIPANVVEQMNPAQRATNRLNWDKHSLEKARQRQGYPLVLRDGFEEMLPQAVPQGTKVPPLKLQGAIPGVVRGGSPEYLRLPADGDVPLTKTLQEIGQRRANVLGALRQGRKPIQGDDIFYADELAGNEQVIKDTKLANRVATFNNGAVKILLGLKNAAAEVGDTVRGRYTKLNELTKTAYGQLEEHIARSGFAGTPRETNLRAGFSRLTKQIKGLDDPALEAHAQADMHKLVEPMLPESSPETHKKLIESSELYGKIQKEAKKAFKATFGNKDMREVFNSTDPSTVEKALNWLMKYKPFVAGTAAIASLVPISSLFATPADAAPYGDRMMLKSAVDAIRASGKPVEQMVAKMIEGGHAAPLLTADGRGIDRLMTGYSFAPKDPSVFPRTTVGKMDSILSPHTRGEIHFNARGENGERLPHSAAVELGDRSQVVAANVEASIAAVNNILKDAGIKSELAELTEATLPLVTKYHNEVNLHAPYWQGRAKMLDDVLEGRYRSDADTKLTAFSKQMKAAKRDVSSLDPEDQAFYQTLKEEKQKALDELGKLEPTLKSFAQEHEATMQKIASTSPTARVALAVDGTGMSGDNPWLLSMLSPAEKEAARKLTALNQVYATRMQETGHNIIAGPYMHHPAHPTVDYGASLKELEKIAPDGPEAMRLVNFYHRGLGSKLMIPDTHYIMGKYIPDAAKRIEISDFWKVGKEGGWDFIRKQMQARGGYEGALKLLDDIRTAFDPVDIGGSAKWLNRYAAFEVARLLTLSPSVSFKHALKLMGNWTVFPTKVSSEATAENLGLWSRQIAQDLAGDTFKGKDFVADLAKAYTNQSHMYAAVSDMAPYELPVAAMDKFLTKWNQLGSSAVNGVERWDRGQTFLSAMMMAQKKGMTPEQARYALMDSVLKVNFLTGPNNPKWLKDPFIRTMMLFQGTPFKILEQRAMLSYQAGKDISNTLKLLNQMRKDVKTGEERFKWHMLADELTKSKDIYGSSYTNQFLKQMLVLGTVIGSGKYAFDSDMWGHAIHIPGLQLGERGANLGLNPAVGAAWKTISGANKTEEDEFWMSRFMQTWLGGTGFPAIARKMARLRDDDIPAMYKDNKLSYLFGLPRMKEK